MYSQFLCTQLSREAQTTKKDTQFDKNTTLWFKKKKKKKLKMATSSFYVWFLSSVIRISSLQSCILSQFYVSIYDLVTYDNSLKPRIFSIHIFSSVLF